MSQKINDAIDEMFTHYTTTDALKREVKYLVKGINEAKNKQAAQVYGKTKYCIQSVIKLSLQQAPMPKVEYYARGFQSEVDRTEINFAPVIKDAFDGSKAKSMLSDEAGQWESK